ncbi:MAG: DUF1501 domain-containing protein, partial [Planctomycetaceae bacterium]
MNSRRDFLFNGGLGFGSLALGSMLASDAAAETFQARNPLSLESPDTPGTATNVIFLFMQGGPSHLETFDEKPALAKYDGKLLPEELRDDDDADENDEAENSDDSDETEETENTDANNEPEDNGE